MSLYILITLVIILVALGIFCYTRKNRGPYLSSTPIYKEDKLIPITDPDIIKQRQAADRMKKWLDDETERQSRHLDILNYNAVVRNNLLSFINDVEQLNEFWLFLNRNFQLWPNGTNNRYLLPMRHIPYIVSYERTDAQINFILNLVNGVNLIFNIFPTYVEGVRIKATLEFKCRYTDDINEQPVAIYEYVCDKEIRNSLLNNNVKFVSHMCTELRSALNLVYHNDKIDYLFAGHAFYMHGITINEIQPFLRSDDEVLFTYNHYERITSIALPYSHSPINDQLSLCLQSYDELDQNVFNLATIDDYIAQAYYLQLRLTAISTGVLASRNHNEYFYYNSRLVGYTSSILTLFAKDINLIWNA